MHYIPPSAQNTLPELRCQHCGKKLAEGYVDLLVIKCPRCRTYNTLRTDSPKREAAEPTGESVCSQ